MHCVLTIGLNWLMSLCMCLCATWPVKCTAMPGHTCQLISYWSQMTGEGKQRAEGAALKAYLTHKSYHRQTHEWDTKGGVIYKACTIMRALSTTWDFCVCKRRPRRVVFDQEVKDLFFSFPLCPLLLPPFPSRARWWRLIETLINWVADIVKV